MSSILLGSIDFTTISFTIQTDNTVIGKMLMESKAITDVLNDLLHTRLHLIDNTLGRIDNPVIHGKQDVFTASNQVVDYLPLVIGEHDGTAVRTINFLRHIQEGIIREGSSFCQPFNDISLVAQVVIG